jgi:hypothetical protein
VFAGTGPVVGNLACEELSGVHPVIVAEFGGYCPDQPFTDRSWR